MADFDPKTYLAEKTGQGGFDPKRYLSEKTGPGRVFTGKEERAAEERKLVESLGAGPPGLPEDAASRVLGNVLTKGAIGAGKGMFGTHLNIDELLSHLPGLSGIKPNREAWNQEQELYNRTLGQGQDSNFGVSAAGLGDLTGQTAMLAPVGGAAGAVARTALGVLLPQALAAASPLLTLGAEGAAQGGLAAGPDNRGEGALSGLKFGMGAGAGGQLLGKLAQLARGGQEGIRAAQLVKARAAQAEAEKAAAGAVGSATQKGSRLEEQFARYAEDPNLPPELRAAIAQWKASPRSKELVGDVLQNQLEAAPAVSGEIAGKQAALRQLQEGGEEAAQAAADRAMSGGVAMRQVKDRAMRYGLPALAGFLGHHFLGEMGGMMGLAGGSVLRPMFHSMKHLAQSPAFQAALLRGVEGSAGGLAGLAQTAGLGAGGVIPYAMPQASGMPAPVLAGDSQTLGQLAFARPRTETR